MFKKKNIVFYLVITTFAVLYFIIVSYDLKKENEYSDDLKSSYSMAYNIDKYTKKIWVAQEWSGESEGYYHNLFSFYITKIENGKIEGRLEINQIAKPDIYTSNTINESWNNENFRGELKDNIAECYLKKDSYEGYVTLIFQDNDIISADLVYICQDDNKTEYKKSGSFRPFNLSDVENLIINEDLIQYTSLDSWGEVYIVPGIVTYGNKSLPCAYLVIESFDILYEFSTSYKTASEIESILVDDLNGDGYKDIKITTYFPRDPDIETIEWIFYQLENGMFYTINNLFKRLETKKSERSHHDELYKNELDNVEGVTSKLIEDGIS